MLQCTGSLDLLFFCCLDAGIKKNMLIILSLSEFKNSSSHEHDMFALVKQQQEHSV